MLTAALGTVSPKAQRGRVVRFPAKKATKPPLTGGLLNGFVMPSMAEREAAAKRAAEILPGLLSDLEAPPVDDAARARLEKLIARGPETVTLLIRAIIESEGNQEALVEPVIGAVDQVMIWRPKWPARAVMDRGF